MKKMKDKILLYRDENQLINARGNEDKLRSQVKEISEIVFKAMGTRSLNYSLLIENGTTVLVDAYINEFAPNFPIHLDKQNRFLADTQTDLKKLESILLEYNRIASSLISKPIINPEGGFSSQINDSDFDMYLVESERDFYNTVIDFMNILNKVQSEKYIHQNYYSTAINLTRHLYFSSKDTNQAILRHETFSTSKNV
jgi:hypothetical protein